MNDVPLFDFAPGTPEIKTKILQGPVWSEHKANLIASYLRYFVYITHHGTYIDAFAGPQTDSSNQAWTAQMVLNSEPKWFRHFHLFDKSPTQAQQLQRLADEHRDRDVRVHVGDSNLILRSVLPIGSIGDREATFCLLDQRTFECEWQLCQYISRLRPESMKVEQFYFLANRWIHRALASIKTPEGERKVKAWLGKEDWKALKTVDPPTLAEIFTDKFKKELGYRYVKPWPIYKRAAGEGGVMYYMIHATDHKASPRLMYDAYCSSVDPPPKPPHQPQLEMKGHDNQ